MTADLSFLRSIGESSDDLELRRIFADWLQDQGDSALAARSELVRVQCDLAEWVPERQRRDELRQREQALLAEVRQEWLGPWFAREAEGTIVNGLPRVSLSAYRFLNRSFAEQLPDLCRYTWPEMVRLDELRLVQVNRLARCSGLACLAGLDLSANNLEDEHLRRLLQSEHLGELRQLDLSNNQLSDGSARMLADSGLLRQLVRLDLRNNRMTGTGVLWLLERAGRQLKHLEVSGNGLSQAALRVLRNWREEPIRRRLHAGRPARLLNHLGMELALIPAGEFLMGSPDSEPERDPTEGPRHEVGPDPAVLPGRLSRQPGPILPGDGQQPQQFPARRTGRGGGGRPGHALVPGGDGLHRAGPRVLPDALGLAGGTAARTEVPVADRGRVGVRLPGRRPVGLAVRFRSLPELAPGQLQRRIPLPGRQFRTRQRRLGAARIGVSRPRAADSQPTLLACMTCTATAGTGAPTASAWTITSTVRARTRPVPTRAPDT